MRYVQVATTMETYVFGCLAAIGMFGVGLGVVLGVAALHRLRPAANRTNESLPAVSILRPLCGVDDELVANLASLAALDYPRLQIVLGVAETSDPAYRIACSFRDAHPEISVRVETCPVTGGHNPKVRILEHLTEVASYDCILVSDSNVRLGPQYLREMTSVLQQPGVGLVTSPIIGVGERSLGALLENLHLGTFILGSVCALSAVDHPCVIGKSILIRRSLLRRLGGWRRFRDVLAEDYLLGAAVSQAGYRVELSRHPIHTVNVQWGVRRFWNRHVRWAQMRRRLHLGAYLCEPLFTPVPWLGAALAIGWGFGMPEDAFALLGAALLARGGFEAWHLGRLRPGSSKVAALLAGPVKDVAILAVWWTGLVQKNVVWREHRFEIGKGTVLRATSLPAFTPLPETVRQGHPLPAGAWLEPSVGAS